jgi:hypothetical protein
MTKKTVEEQEKEQEYKPDEEHTDVSEEVDVEDEEDEEDDEDERIPIDLSQNEVYKGICTLFEDEEGNNILEYISLIHTELIGMNKSLEFLRGIKKDLSRIADCAEIMAKGKKSSNEKDKKR